MFSVVVPTYNRPQSLKKLLESLNEQTLSKSDFEVIVIFTEDDLSEEFLKKNQYSFQLTPLKIEDSEFNGRSASLKRNRGIQQSQGEWIAFIDDDCIADKEWLKNALDVIHKHNPSGIEGLTQIPNTSKQTFTAKGLKFLSRFGGYQTCNMFYKKDILLSIGGFDPQLPFYLEDTDLAWSVLEKNKSIIPSEKVIVTHPVPPANVYRWIENALRTRKIPYLAKKHPDLFKKMKFQALSRSHKLMLIFLLFFTITSFFGIVPVYISFLLYFLLSFLYVIYLTRDCVFDIKEFAQMNLAFPIVPIISIIQLLRGNIEQRTFIL